MGDLNEEEINSSVAAFADKLSDEDLDTVAAFAVAVRDNPDVVVDALQALFDSEA